MNKVSIIINSCFYCQDSFSQQAYFGHPPSFCLLPPTRCPQLFPSVPVSFSLTSTCPAVTFSLTHLFPVSSLSQPSFKPASSTCFLAACCIAPHAVDFCSYLQADVITVSLDKLTELFLFTWSSCIWIMVPVMTVLCVAVLSFRGSKKGFINFVPHTVKMLKCDDSCMLPYQTTSVSKLKHPGVKLRFKWAFEWREIMKKTRHTNNLTTDMN